MSRAMDQLRAKLQYLLPQHLLTWLMNRLSYCRLGWWKNTLIRAIARLYRINWSEAASDELGSYPHFNAFFTRTLKPGARVMDTSGQFLLCPSDGFISQGGAITDGQLIQAKGHQYSVHDLLAGDPAGNTLQGGEFLTVYLSPRDYHRVHMPAAGTLKRMSHVPGRLFSVAPYTVQNIAGLFARNERVISIFDGLHGEFAVALVGAMLVGSMATVWHGTVNPPRARSIRRFDYSDQPSRFDVGEQMGHFNMGSTVILLLPPGMTRLQDSLEPGQAVRVGQTIGRLVSA